MSRTGELSSRGRLHGIWRVLRNVTLHIVKVTRLGIVARWLASYIYQTDHLIHAIHMPFHKYPDKQSDACNLHTRSQILPDLHHVSRQRPFAHPKPMHPYADASIVTQYPTFDANRCQIARRISVPPSLPIVRVGRVAAPAAAGRRIFRYWRPGNWGEAVRRRQVAVNRCLRGQEEIWTDRLGSGRHIWFRCRLKSSQCKLQCVGLRADSTSHC
jgi:hypothetical protein